MNEVLEEKKAPVLTHSRWRMWWLTTVKGYHLTQRTRVPKYAFLGRVVYLDTWWLDQQFR